MNYQDISYPVMEIFSSLQGEGFNYGSAANFIRLAGCNVSCVWCDVKESWKAEKYPLLTSFEIEKKLKKSIKNIIITGGEPTLYNLFPLTKFLSEKNYNLWLETAGTNNITGIFNWICLSPKKFKKVFEPNFALANELKIIIYNEHDFEWAEKMSEKVNKNCYLYLQPEWSKRNKILPLIIRYIKENPKWKISLQTHKYMCIP